MSIYEARIQDARRRFQTWTTEHIITECVEADCMRYLKIQKPGTWACGYTVTTWPGYLAIAGDLGSALFTRLPDMFEFFRSPSGSINPGYWAEKAVAVSRDGIEEFDVETLRESLRDNFEEHSPGELDKALTAIADLSNLEEREAIEALEPMVSEPWELNRTQYTYQFLYLLHAIVLAIRLYDARAAQPILEAF